MEGISSGLYLVLSTATRFLNRRGGSADAEDQITAVMAALKRPRRTSSIALAEELCSLGCNIEPDVLNANLSKPSPDFDLEAEQLSPQRQLALAVLELMARKGIAEAFGLTCPVSVNSSQAESQGV